MSSQNKSGNNNKSLIFGAAAAVAVAAGVAFFFLLRKQGPSTPESTKAKANVVAVAAENPKQEQKQQKEETPVPRPTIPTTTTEQQVEKTKGVTFNQKVIVEEEIEVEEEELSEEDRKKQEAEDELALEIDTIFTFAFTDEILKKDWNESAAVFQRARELLPIAEKFIQVPDEEAQKYLEKQDREWDEKEKENKEQENKENENKSNNNNDDASVQTEKEKKKKTALELKLDDKEERIRYLVKSEEMMYTQLRQVLQSSMDLFRCEEYENLPFGNPEKIQKAKDVETQVDRVLLTLAKLHVPPAKKNIMIRFCENVKELAELNAGQDDEEVETKN